MMISSLTNTKQNCTICIIPPHLFTFPLDCPVCSTCPISSKTHGNVSIGHNFSSNNDRHPWFEAFWSQWIYLSKTHKGQIFLKLVVDREREKLAWRERVNVSALCVCAIHVSIVVCILTCTILCIILWVWYFHYTFILSIGINIYPKQSCYSVTTT